MSELQTRAAGPVTFDTDKHTVDVVFSTGAGVQRVDLQGPYIEELSMEPGAVNLSELIGGPALNNHDRSNVNAVLGVVETASMTGGRGIATIRFSERPEVQGTVSDIQTGIIRAVSCGYSVEEWRTSRRADGMRVKTAVRWTPKEISFAPIGADPAARTRSEGMNEQLQEQIRSIATTIGVSATFADDLIQRNSTLEDARTAIVREAARSIPTIDHRAPAVVTRETAPEEMARNMGDALYTRINPAHQPGEQARQYVGLRVADLAREMLRTRGLNTFGADAEVITRSLTTTSDLPLLLSNVTNKVLREAYQVAPSGIKAVCKRSTATDFKPKYLLRRGELPTLEKLNENGEFRHGGIVEGRESYSISTFGKVFGIARQALINDDLGSLADIAAGWGLAAQEFENGFLVDLLASNTGTGPKLADTKALFHADHGNMAGTGAVISDTSLSAARLALRGMKGLDGKTPINATAKYLVVPAAIETTAEKYLATIAPAQATNVNPFSGKFTLVVDPRLDGKSLTRWYLFADPAVLPVLEYAYLQGFEGPQVETRNGFDVDGVEVRCRLDFGAGGIDSRGAYCNPGA